MLLGKSSIYWISVILLANSIGLEIVYMNVFGDTAKSVMTEIFWPDVSKDDANFGMTRACWVLCLAVLLFPLLLLKELAELKQVSIALFMATCVFVVTTIF